MLPYNTGKYHETPEGIPMLHTIDHSLTETILSLSPSSQFMYEPEMTLSTSCGQSQGSAGGPLVCEGPSYEDFIKSEGIISPSVEVVTFQDCIDTDGPFSPLSDELAFNGCFELSKNFGSSVPEMPFEGHIKQDGTFSTSSRELEFDDCGKLDQVFGTSLEGMSFHEGQKSGNDFGILSEGMRFEDRGKADATIPSTSEVRGLDVEGIGNDWFELDKDIYEMSKESDMLLQDPVFSGGPTLTQLNSKDLDSTSLDDFILLEDLYAKAFPNDRLLPVPSTNLEPTTAALKTTPGMASGTAPVTSPKFTTCTITSFVTTVSASGVPSPQYPTYLTNELLANQDVQCVRSGGIPDVMSKQPVPQSQWAVLMSTMAPLAPANTNPCFMQVLSSGSPLVDLVGSVVLPSSAVPGSSVSMGVPQAPPKPSLQLSMAVGDSLKNSMDQNWEEIERFLLGSENREPMAAQFLEANKCQLNMKTEPQDVALNPDEEMSDKEESLLEDSDIECSEIDNSDEESFNAKSEDLHALATSSRKEKKYFWQYNTQSKGPKGKRLCKSVETEDPHVLHDFEDPVFDPEQNQTRYKHNGKARRGDGNDITPNPYKLYVTGNELKKLNKLINNITPSSDMPASARAKMLKEKNKYASRACRLKKKAQHEANKLKLHGLELEHRQLMKVLVSMKKEIMRRVKSQSVLKGQGEVVLESMSNKLQSIMKQNLTLTVAGHTADFVNAVLQKVAKGDRMGGITIDD